MEAIEKNPFRILGIPANASEKEIQRQINICKRFAEVGKIKEFDYDMKWLGKISRDAENIQRAASKIERPDNKIEHSLYWFLDVNKIDQMAIDYLNDGNREKAIEIWEKTVKSNDLNKKLVAQINLSNLYITKSISQGGLAISPLKKGLELKSQILKSDDLSNYCAIISDDRYKVDKDTLYRRFVKDTITSLKEYTDRKIITEKEIVELFNTFPQEIKKEVVNYFVGGPISTIENQVEKTGNKRSESPKNANHYGTELYKNTKSKITYIHKILGDEHIKYQMTANKLANEIMQCSVDYFNAYEKSDSNFDPGDTALKVIKYAKSIATTGETSDRIKKNMENIQDWIGDRSYREKINGIESEIKYLNNTLGRLNKIAEVSSKLGPPNTNEDILKIIYSTKSLSKECKPKLETIKLKLGAYDDLYLKYSYAIANIVISIIILVVNSRKFRINISLRGRSKKVPSDLEMVLKESIDTIKSLSSFDKNYKLRFKIFNNKRKIKKIYRELRFYSEYHEIENSPDSSEGCYIATMAYGDYDAPEVLVFRKYRDQVLKKSLLGKLFIRTYYFVSPKIVALIKNKESINNVIKNALNKIARRIK